MMSVVRHALAGVVAAVVVLLGVSVPSVAMAQSPSPAAGATAGNSATTGATPKATATDAADEGEDGSGPDDTQGAAPDDSRQTWALGAAGLLAVLAAAVVLLRR